MNESDDIAGELWELGLEASFVHTDYENFTQTLVIERSSLT
jgi:hypothetical protein